MREKEAKKKYVIVIVTYLNLRHIPQCEKKKTTATRNNNLINIKFNKRLFIYFYLNGYVNYWRFKNNKIKKSICFLLHYFFLFLNK